MAKAKEETKEETKEEELNIYQKLLKAVDSLPKEAIEKASKEITRKGYDTTGYQYQFLVNVLNEVLGIGQWDFTYTILRETEGKWSNGRSFWDITVDVKVTFKNIGSFNCVGGHKSELHADALKGAITNGFKKTVAFFGVGKKAYEGTIDEDYRPLPQENKPELKKPEPQKPAQPELTFDELSEPAKQIMSAFDLSATIKVLSNCVGQNKDEIAKLPKAEADYLRNYYTKRLAEIKSGKGIK